MDIDKYVKKIMECLNETESIQESGIQGIVSNKLVRLLGYDEDDDCKYAYNINGVSMDLVILKDNNPILPIKFVRYSKNERENRIYFDGPDGFSGKISSAYTILKKFMMITDCHFGLITDGYIYGFYELCEDETEDDESILNLKRIVWLKNLNSEMLDSEMESDLVLSDYQIMSI